MPGAFARIVRSVVPLVVVVACAATGRAQGAEELLSRMRAKYAGCGTYREQARRRTRREDGGHWFRGDEYRIAFARAGRLRLESGEKRNWKYRGENVLWRDGSDWAYWGDRERAPTHGTADRAVRLALSSDPIAQWILPLLGVPELEDGTFGSSWKNVRPTGAVAREEIDGVAVSVVELAGDRQRARVAVDAAGALRRIEVVRSGEISYRDEIDLAPEFDVALTPAELALSPPGKSGIDPESLLIVLSGAALVLMGVTGLQRARRLAKSGRPFMVSGEILIPAAGMLVGLETLLRVANGWDSIVEMEWNGLFAVALALVPVALVGQEHWRSAGFMAIGVTSRDFRLALRAAADALGSSHAIPVAGDKAKIDGCDVSIWEKPSLSIVGIRSRTRAVRQRIREMQPLVETCIESRSMPIDRRASLRSTLWSLLFIAAGSAIVLVAGSLVDLF
jgi:hypothetical protein